MKPDVTAIQKRLHEFNESRRHGYDWGAGGPTEAMILFRDYAPGDVATLLAYVKELDAIRVAATTLIATYNHHPEGDWFVRDDNFDATDTALETLHDALVASTP